MKAWPLLAASAAAALLAAGSAGAAVVAGPTIDGLATFTDTTTGLNWLRLDDFKGESVDQMIATATADGFLVAQKHRVKVLTDALSLAAPGSWASYASIIGASPSGTSIWGAYGPVAADGGYGSASAGNGDSVWLYVDDHVADGEVGELGGLWAFLPAGGVPEPGVWALMILGLALTGSALRRKAWTGAIRTR